MHRIGLGYDIHALVDGRRLYLGGIKIPYPKGLMGHSDGDALLHAICDALLGALAEGDIGEHFPDSEAEYKGISSIKLLKKVKQMVKKKKFSVKNLDTVVIAEEPRLTPFKKKMRKKISKILDIKEDRVSVKAKTNEGFAEVGRRQAVSAYAVALISKGD